MLVRFDSLVRFLISALAVFVACWICYRAVTAHSQEIGSYQPVLTNLKTGMKAVWKGSFPDQNRCDQAIKGINERLAAIADPDPNKSVPDAPEADPAIANSLDQLVVRLWMNTGALPTLSISCERVGERA